VSWSPWSCDRSAAARAERRGGAGHPQKQVAQLRFSHPALAADQRHARRAGADLVEDFDEGRQLPAAADDVRVLLLGNRCDEGVSVAGVGPDERGRLRVVGERDPDFVDQDLDVVGMHVGVGPHRAHDVGLGDRTSGPIHEAAQQRRRFPGQRNLLVPPPERAVAVELKGLK
jgi:hypothetical protein